VNASAADTAPERSRELGFVALEIGTRSSTHQRTTTADGPQGPQRQRFGRRWSAIVGIIVIGWVLWELGIGRRSLVNGSGFGELGRFFAAAIRPRLRFESGFGGDSELVLGRVWSATLVTLAFAVLGAIIGVGLGLIGGLVATSARRDHMRKSLIGKCISGLTIPMRSTHELLWALILVNIFGINPIVAVLAIVIPFAAVSTKVFAELFEAQPRGPFLALRTAGASQWTSFWYAIAPGALRDVSSYAFYRFECAIRAAAVLGVVGAGGLGYELSLSFSEADYRGMWSFIWPLVALCTAAEALSSGLRSTNPTSSRRIKLSRLRRPVPLIGAMLASSALAWWYLKIDVTTMWAERARREFGMLRAQWLPPDVSQEFRGQLWTSTRETFAIALGSIMLSAIIGIVFAIISARSRGGTLPGLSDSSTTSLARLRRRSQSGLRWTSRHLGRAVLLFARAIPPSIWAFLVVLVLFPGPLPAAVALGIYNAGVLGRLFTEVLENLNQGPFRALRAAGASPTKATLYTTIPQAAPSFATYTLYRWEVAVRETLVVGVAAAGGIGALLKQELAAFDWAAVASLIVAFFVVTFAVELISGAVRRRLVRA
jgi:phosphonate transport system permease protein